MATTLALNSGALWFTNYTVEATIATTVLGSTAIQANYPVTNLNDPHRSLGARWTWDNSGYATITTESSAAIAPTAIALVDTNLASITGTPTFTFRLRGSTDATYATNYKEWNLKHYTTETGVMRWYLDYASVDGSNGTFTSGKYWRLEFNPNTAGTFGAGFTELQIGEVILSVPQNIEIASGLSIEQRDPSRRAASWDGTEYFDILASHADVSFGTTPMSHSDFYALLTLVRDHGPRLQLLDVHGYAASVDAGATSSTVDAASAYYGRMSSGTLAQVNVTSVTNTQPRFKFTEARG